MTAIAALIHDGRIVMGGDSAGVAGMQMTVRKDAKVFTVGPYLIGFTDSFRMGQLIRYAFEMPPPPDNLDDLHRHMCTTWVTALRDCLFKGGWAIRDDCREIGGTFLVGVKGRLFEVNSDFQVGESANGYAAAGCGEEIALGALYATAHLEPEVRILTALAAAEHHSAGVRTPFTIAWQPEGV